MKTNGGQVYFCRSFLFVENGLEIYHLIIYLIMMLSTGYLRSEISVLKSLQDLSQIKSLMEVNTCFYFSYMTSIFKASQNISSRPDTFIHLVMVKDFNLKL